MFQSARLKLTAWYLIIIMIISLLFSLIIYGGINRELERFSYFRQTRIGMYRFTEHVLPSPFDPEMINSARERIVTVLIFINIGILGLSGVASYFLAGKTLKPIKKMVDEQNRFVTDASHELRTPLTSLRTEIEVNLRDKKLSLEAAKKLLESNLEEVINLQKLSDHLMSLAAYHGKNGSIVFEKLQLAKVIEESIKKVQALSKTKKISLKKDIENSEIMGNRQSLEELFVILLDNAVKYSEGNTVVKINSKKNDGVVVTKVEDQGTGIDQKDIPYIFDRFYRADKSRSKDKSSGYGLGLSIAKKIVELHGGKINVESKPGKGSVFTVSLLVS